MFAVQQQVPTPTQSPVTHNEPVAQSPIIILDPPENPNPVLVHLMVTRFRVGTNRPTERLNLYVSLVSPLPKSYRDAFSDPNWQNAMRNEYHALIKNKTWTLVPRPPDTNMVRCMWLFHHKYLADGTLSRYKARLVANGSTQLEGVDVDETFSPIVKPISIRTQIIRSLHQEFAMTNLGSLNYFLSKSVTRDSPGLFLSQKKYAIEILDRVHMVNCNPNRTPINIDSKLGSDGDSVLTRLYIGVLQMQIGLDVLLLDARLQVNVFLLATTYSLGPLSVSRRFLILVQRHSIVVLPMLLLRRVGYAIYCRTKHIEIDIHFVLDIVAADQLVADAFRSCSNILAKKVGYLILYIVHTLSREWDCLR
nr:ribonuclease H-like domain-containing protein [Tanacetum cinerariifolium]